MDPKDKDKASGLLCCLLIPKDKDNTSGLLIKDKAKANGLL
jgi:hypothetical protein